LLLLCSTSAITVNSAHSADELSYQLPYYNSKEFTPHWIGSGSEALNGFHQIPPFSFTNQDGEEVSEKDFENKIYVKTLRIKSMWQAFSSARAREFAP